MKKGILLAILSLMLCLLTGCLEATPLNDEEMDVVAEYAASLLLKHDKKYSTPLFYTEDKEVRLTPTPTPTEKPKNPITENNQTGSNEAQKPQEPEAIMYNDKETGRQLTELISVDGISISCKGCELKDSVVSNNYFSLQAKEGRQYAVVKFTLQNTSNREIRFDASGKGLEYSIDVNTGTVSRVSLSLLENDMQYMEIPVPAGGTAEAVLVFEIADVEIDTLHLRIHDKEDNSVFVKLQ